MNIDSPCFKFHETRELTLRIEEVGRSATKASHAGIIRIGFEGISQPHFVEHPCFNNLIETLRALFCKARFCKLVCDLPNFERAHQSGQFVGQQGQLLASLHRLL